MNDTLVASEIQDLASSVDKIADAISSRELVVNVSVPELMNVNINPTVTPPNVNVEAAVVNVPPTVVNVPTPIVNVAAPVVNVPAAAAAVPVAYRIEITERDAKGQIVAFVMVPYVCWTRLSSRFTARAMSRAKTGRRSLSR
jgi:hypothetical protein